MTENNHPGEGVLVALRMYAEDYEDVPTMFSLDIGEVNSLLDYVESLERQINAHPPMEIDPDA